MVNMFVSYCQKDAKYANIIDSYFKNKSVVIHRDIRDISPWKSIRKYMQTIRDMDYAVLIITNNYLKSFNCMYEVLEVMKEKNYENKIFPVVIETSIYSPSGKISYIKYWEDKYNELKNQINKIEVVNAGNIIDDLKKTQNVCSSMSEFLSKVADMNNPDVSNINMVIENKLKEQGLLDSKGEVADNRAKENKDIFSSLNIAGVNANSNPTDLEKDKFITISFENINKLLKELCNQVEKESSNIQVRIEKIDNKTIIYKFYKNGNQVRMLKLFLGNCLGMRSNNIGLSCENYSFSNNNSFEGIISSKVKDGKLALYFMIGISFSQDCKSVEEVVKEVWTVYIQPYISR